MKYAVVFGYNKPNKSFKWNHFYIYYALEKLYAMTSLNINLIIGKCKCSFERSDNLVGFALVVK